MRKNRTRNLTIAAGMILAVLLFWFVARPALFPGEEGEPIPSAVTADEAGNRVIHWESIVIPDYVERDLLPVNEYSRPGIYLEDVRGVVVHYTANPGSSAKGNRDYFAGLADGTSGTYASSHFVIDTDGSVIQCIPLSEVSYASNDRNYDTISIECCHKDETGKFTKATYRSLVRLTVWLCETFDLETSSVIRHYDVTGKLCPLYYVEHEDKWRDFLSDVEKGRR